MPDQVCYDQLSSIINPSFWNKLTETKLNVDKLHEVQHHIWGYFNLLANKACSTTLLEVDSTSFNCLFNGQNMYVPFHGILLNKNTIEDFKGCNKTDLINEVGDSLYEKIKNGDVLQDPSLLNCFLVLSFADLKKYHYYYWFAFPVPRGLAIEKISSQLLSLEFSANEANFCYEEYNKLEVHHRSYFVIKRSKAGITVDSLNQTIKTMNPENKDQFYFAFYNITHDNSAIGSQLKNYITMIIHYCPFLQGNITNFVAFSLSRDGSHITCSQSTVYRLKLPQQENNVLWVGWEKNEQDKMCPRLANMKNTLDPLVIAENSVDLNLKLMKWRVLPDIDLEKIKNTKCLLLGSGTLGCSVARTLLAWGVRNITFVDNSTVSYSNPVRQSLFTYLDSVQMKPKSLAAADNLKCIFPGVNSKGIQLTIPMPGHSVGESQLADTKETVDKLKDLIINHDLIFLLMDSRESRWLPTLLASFYNKITINAALGFDTYLVMRHGIRHDVNNVLAPVKHPEGFKSLRGSELSCYFCNDVTAPGNSLKDRTLDQQCTVTRPGVSQIAGALAVELAMSILQHKQSACAPAFYQVSQKSNNEGTNIEDQSLLGLVPHSIRGFLSSFEQILPATQRYKHCIACSDIILREYDENGMDFLMKVWNNSKHLEDVAELTDMFKDINFEDVLELSDEDI